MTNFRATIRVVTDNQTGFPLLEIPGLEFAVSWLPLTRIQLEYFLSDTNDARFDAEWYTKTVMKDNPRVSPHHVERNNIEGVLATNILLPEARRITDWFCDISNHIYDLPTAAQWQKICRIAREYSTQPFSLLPDTVEPRAAALIDRLQSVLTMQTLADQMLIGAGVAEYVYVDDARQSCSFTEGQQGHAKSFSPVYIREGSRNIKLSFRLICRTI